MRLDLLLIEEDCLLVGVPIKFGHMDFLTDIDIGIGMMVEGSLDLLLIKKDKFGQWVDSNL